MADESYTIRPARPDDADAVTAMWQEMADQHSTYDDVRWGWKDDAAARWRDYFIKSIAKENSILLVAVDAADYPVGYLKGNITTPPLMGVRCRGEVTDIVIKADCRGRGVGKMLMETAIGIMKCCGVGYVVVEVASANEQAIRFYESLGMRTVVRQMYKGL